MRRLSAREREILAATYFAADRSAREVADTIGAREHLVRHSLRSLKKDGLIKLRPYWNPFAIGYHEYVAWLSLHSANRSQRRALCTALVKSPRTTYVTDVEGHYQIFVMFLARSIEEVDVFFDGISAAAPRSPFTKTVGGVRRVTLFTPKRFLNGSVEADSLSYFPVKEAHAIDDVGRKILSAFAAAVNSSSAELARSVGLPVTTVDYRIRSMMEHGIVLAIGYTSISFDDGVIPYGLLIETASSSSAKREQLRNFCRKHPRVSAILHVVGPWEHQVEVEVHDGREIADIVQEFYDAFPSYTQTIRTIPIGMMHKMTPYPLRDSDEL